MNMIISVWNIRCTANFIDVYSIAGGEFQFVEGSSNVNQVISLD